MSRKTYALISILLITAVLASLFFFTDARSFLSSIMSDRFDRELNENPYVFYRHYFNELNENEKLAYINIYNKIGNFPERIEIPQLSEAELDRVFKAIRYTTPTLSPGSTCQMLAVSGRYYFILLFSKDETKQLKTKAKIESVVSSSARGS